MKSVIGKYGIIGCLGLVLSPFSGLYAAGPHSKAYIHEFTPTALVGGTTGDSLLEAMGDAFSVRKYQDFALYHLRPFDANYPCASAGSPGSTSTLDANSCRVTGKNMIRTDLFYKDSSKQSTGTQMTYYRSETKSAPSDYATLKYSKDSVNGDKLDVTIKPVLLKPVRDDNASISNTISIGAPGGGELVSDKRGIEIEPYALGVVLPAFLRNKRIRLLSDFSKDQSIAGSLRAPIVAFKKDGLSSHTSANAFRMTLNTKCVAANYVSTPTDNQALTAALCDYMNTNPVGNNSAFYIKGRATGYTQANEKEPFRTFVISFRPDFIAPYDTNLSRTKGFTIQELEAGNYKTDEITLTVQLGEDI